MLKDEELNDDCDQEHIASFLYNKIYSDNDSEEDLE